MSICVATLTSDSTLDKVMQDDEMALEVVVPVEEKDVDSIALGKTIWNEITAGVGIWGAFRPVFAIVLALIPFLFLGQHFKIEDLVELTKISCLNNLCRYLNHQHYLDSLT